MNAIHPIRTELAGRFISLVPMTEADLPELFTAIGDPVTFAGGYGGGPAGYRSTLDGFTERARNYYH